MYVLWCVLDRAVTLTWCPDQEFLRPFPFNDDDWPGERFQSRQKVTETNRAVVWALTWLDAGASQSLGSTNSNFPGFKTL